jgi:hypothetical protein
MIMYEIVHAMFRACMCVHAEESSDNSHYIATTSNLYKFHIYLLFSNNARICSSLGAWFFSQVILDCYHSIW